MNLTACELIQALVFTIASYPRQSKQIEGKVGFATWTEVGNNIQD